MHTKENTGSYYIHNKLKINYEDSSAILSAIRCNFISLIALIKASLVALPSFIHLVIIFVRPGSACLNVSSLIIFKAESRKPKYIPSVYQSATSSTACNTA